MMAPQAIVVLLIVIALPIGWLASEFGKRRYLRIILGTASIASAIGVAFIDGSLARLSYNAWYGHASKDLVDTMITQIEDGNLDRVMKVLRRLNLDYQPTYENRAHYDELVNEAVMQMKAEHDLAGSKWDMSPFTAEAWLGHWEDDTGFWMVITEGIDQLKIVRSGDNPPAIRDVKLSEDSRTLTFNEGDRWHHEMTMENKYGATHIWREANTENIWQTDHLHKLVRATPEQKRFTQQTPAN